MMPSQLSPDTQAVLLLCGVFGKSDALKPLTPTEYNRAAHRLADQGMRPGDLLGRDGVRKLETEFQDPKLPTERLAALLDRGAVLALALEKWERSGIWVISRADPAYPSRLRRRLGGGRPPLLFGAGPVELLEKKGFAAIGSRNADLASLELAHRFGARCAAEGLTLISGGAKGVDDESMAGALEAGGEVVGVLAANLLRSASSGTYRKAIRAGQLTLVTPYAPEADFSAGNAMGRNRYIYTLSDGALAVHSGQKGGTWSGALDNLKKGFVPLFVPPLDDPKSGNAALIKKGAVPYREDDGSLTALFEKQALPLKEEKKKENQLGLDFGD